MNEWMSEINEATNPLIKQSSSILSHSVIQFCNVGNVENVRNVERITPGGTPSTERINLFLRGIKYRKPSHSR